MIPRDQSVTNRGSVVIYRKTSLHTPVHLTRRLMKNAPNLSASVAQILPLKIGGSINQFKTHLRKKALDQCSHECNKIKAPLSGPARRRPNDYYFSFNPMPKFRPLIYISFSIYTRFRHVKDFYERHILWPEVEICQFTNKRSF